MTSTFESLQRIRKLQVQPWNTSGYRLAKPSPMFVDEYMLGGVMALDSESQSLLAFPGADPGGLEIIRNFPFESEDTPAALLQIERRRLVDGSRIAHVASGPTGEPHFAIDVEHQRILEVPAVVDLVSGSPVKSIELDLPDGVRLTMESHLAVLPRDPQKIEIMAPSLFVSSPASHVVLKIDRASGAATVIAGQIGNAGTPGQRDQHSRSASRRDSLGRASHTLLGSPRGLFFDGVTQKLLIADSANGAIYAITPGGAIELVATSDPAHRNSEDVAYFAELDHVRGMMLYRLATFHVDERRLERNAIETTAGWDRYPVTIIFWDDTSRVVTAWLNTAAKHRNPFSTKFLGVQSAVVHPSGEMLLLAADRVGLMRHPNVLTETHFANDSRSPG